MDIKRYDAFSVRRAKRKVLWLPYIETDGAAPFSPRRMGFVRSTGQWIEVSKPLLPAMSSYIQTKNRCGHDELAAVHHVARVLSYESGRDALIGGDLEFADWVWQNGGQYRRNESIADRRLDRDHGRRGLSSCMAPSCGWTGGEGHFLFRWTDRGQSGRYG